MSATYHAEAHLYPEIISPEIEPSYYKAADGTRKPHINDDPSNKRVTSSVGVFLPSRWQSYNTLNTWSPFEMSDYLWRYSGDGEMDNLAKQSFDTHSYISYSRLLFDFPSIGSPKHTTFKVNIVDTDPSPTLSARYSVEWHLPWDNWQRYGRTQRMWEEIAWAEYSSVDGAVHGGGVNVTYAFGNPYYAFATEGLEKAGEVIGAFEMFRFPVSPIFKTLVDIAGIDVVENVEANKKVTQPDHWQWGGEDSTYVPSRMDDQQVYYRMFPTVAREYEISFWEGDTYDGHGYVGMGRRAIRKDTQGRKVMREFRFVGDGGGSGTPGGNDYGD